MGYDREETMNKTYGGSYPARLWKAAMSAAVAGSKGSFPIPSGVEQVAICKISGKLATPACPEEDIEVKMLKAQEKPRETCDQHILIKICPESGKLATPGCPSPVDQGFLKDLPPGTPGAPPRDYCDIHGGQQTARTVKVCTDPRHQGRLYLANIPGQGEFGGCPGSYVAEIEVDNPDDLGYCPLPDHQRHR